MVHALWADATQKQITRTAGSIRGRWLLRPVRRSHDRDGEAGSSMGLLSAGQRFEEGASSEFRAIGVGGDAFSLKEANDVVGALYGAA
jgi:hypothetical protein